MLAAPPTLRIVPQRGWHDCGIAALATLQGWTYEHARDVLGPQVTQDGACLLPIMPRLLAAGVAGTYLLPRERARVAPDIAERQTIRLLPTSEEVRELLKGRRALISIRIPGEGPNIEPGSLRGHAVAWDGERMIECGGTGDVARPPRELSFDDYPLQEALILTDAPASVRRPVEIRPATEIDGADAAALAEIFDRHERVFLAFSGGKESVTLARMLEPWRERVTLLWVNTGHMASHMVDFVRAYGERFALEELASPSLLEHWRVAGTPAEVFPQANVTGSAQPRLQPWANCCAALRQEPLNAFLRDQEGPSCFINGQRRQDKDGATVSGLSSQLPPSVEIVMPLADWSEADVFAYIDRHGLELPRQYAEGYPDSIECVVCPAPMKAERLRYIATHYPKAAPIAAAAAKQAARVTMDAVANILLATSTALPEDAQ